MARGLSSIDSITRRGSRFCWAVAAACVLCFPLEREHLAARDGQLPESLSSGQDASIAAPGSASLGAGPAARNVTKDETEPGGPVFSFVDISATGTQLTFFDADNLSIPNADDGVATNVPLGFAFAFAGGTSRRLTCPRTGSCTSS